MRATSKTVLRAAMALTLTIGTVIGASGVAQAQNPFERGPDPTLEVLEAEVGPFETAEEAVNGLGVDGFGGGTIYYPTDTSQGKFGAIAISPGYTADQSSLAWMGPRLASHGFVVFIIDTLGRLDQPHQRGDQLLAALDYLTQESSVAGQVDASRLAVAGHSMGGGGTLEASADRPELQAAVPIAPWNLNKDWSGNQVPTMIVGGQNDLIAPVGSHSVPFYESLTAAPEKAYVELAGASHFFPQLPNTTMSVAMVSWLKRFIDNDTRYEQFLCPPPAYEDVSAYEDSCPSGS